MLFIFIFLFFLLSFSSSPAFARHHNRHDGDVEQFDHHRGHGQQHHNHPRHQYEQGKDNGHNGCGCAGGCAGGGANWMNTGGPAPGVPLFLFPDHILRAVSIVLRADNAFHRDNDELARHLFHLLAQQFPRKWFIIAVGTVPPPANDVFEMPKIWISERHPSETLNGTVALPRAGIPGYGQFPFFDGGRREFQRENGSQLWYIVHAREQNARIEVVSQRPRPTLAKCLDAVERLCPPDSADIGRLCPDISPLAAMAMFGARAEASIVASEPLAADPAQMVLIGNARGCFGNDEDERRAGHVLLVAPT